MSEETAAVSDCKHYWLIDQPNGPTSSGVCKLCGATREDFKNSIQGSGWDRDGRRRRAAQQRRAARSS